LVAYIRLCWKNETSPGRDSLVFELVRGEFCDVPPALDFSFVSCYIHSTFIVCAFIYDFTFSILSIQSMHDIWRILEEILVSHFIFHYPVTNGYIRLQMVISGYMLFVSDYTPQSHVFIFDFVTIKLWLWRSSEHCFGRSTVVPVVVTGGPICYSCLCQIRGGEGAVVRSFVVIRSCSGWFMVCIA